jgi:hypothetical protein
MSVSAIKDIVARVKNMFIGVSHNKTSIRPSQKIGALPFLVNLQARYKTGTLMRMAFLNSTWAE